MEAPLGIGTFGRREKQHYFWRSSEGVLDVINVSSQKCYVYTYGVYVWQRAWSVNVSSCWRFACFYRRIWYEHHVRMCALSSFFSKIRWFFFFFTLGQIVILRKPVSRPRFLCVRFFSCFNPPANVLLCTPGCASLTGTYIFVSIFLAMKCTPYVPSITVNTSKKHYQVPGTLHAKVPGTCYILRSRLTRYLVRV